MATKRMGVSFSESKQLYVFVASNGSEINVSDSLYNVVKCMFEHTNTQMNKTRKSKFVRHKIKAGDVNAGLPDCVPAAIAHMSVGAPSYEDAIKKCDELFPTWRTAGGVPVESVYSFINKYTPVNKYTNLSFCDLSNDSTSLNNMVMVFYATSTIHAANAHKCSKVPGCTVIHYHDYSATSAGDGLITSDRLIYIYPYANFN